MHISKFIYTCILSETNFHTVAMGCPIKNPNTPAIQEPGNSKHNVRCCSTNGESCSSQPCKRGRTYDEAVEICSSRGERLCYEHELNKCCGTGCRLDNKHNWIADQLKGTVQPSVI